MSKKIVLDAAKALAHTRQPTTPSTTKPASPASSVPSVALDETGNKLLGIVKNLTDTVSIEATRTNGDRRAAREVAKLARELASTWAMIHGELRQSLQAMSSEQYKEALQALIAALPADPPAPAQTDESNAYSATTNFSENKVPSTTSAFDALDAEGEDPES